MSGMFPWPGIFYPAGAFTVCTLRTVCSIMNQTLWEKSWRVSFMYCRQQTTFFRYGRMQQNVFQTIGKSHSKFTFRMTLLIWCVHGTLPSFFYYGLNRYVLGGPYLPFFKIMNGNLRFRWYQSFLFFILFSLCLWLYYNSHVFICQEVKWKFINKNSCNCKENENYIIIWKL